MLPQSLQQSMLEASARTASGVQESVAAIETIRIFSAEEEEEKQHSWNLAKQLRLKEQIELELAFFTLVHRVRGGWEWEHQGVGIRDEDTVKGDTRNGNTGTRNGKPASEMGVLRTEWGHQEWGYQNRDICIKNVHARNGNGDIRSRMGTLGQRLGRSGSETGTLTVRWGHQDWNEDSETGMRTPGTEIKTPGEGWGQAEWGHQRWVGSTSIPVPTHRCSSWPSGSWCSSGAISCSVTDTSLLGSSSPSCCTRTQSAVMSR